jgi:hypothetical protein
MTGTPVCCLECCPETKNGSVPLPGWNAREVLPDSYSKRMLSFGQEKLEGVGVQSGVFSVTDSQGRVEGLRFR